MCIYFGSLKHLCMNKTVQKTAKYVVGIPHRLGCVLAGGILYSTTETLFSENHLLESYIQ